MRKRSVYPGVHALRIGANVVHMMPVLDGIGLSRMLREEPATAGMLVILMSAARPPDLAAAGAVAFMGKPFMVEQVNALIARHPAHDT